MAGRLKPLEVARLVEPGKYPDGDGLYLIVAGLMSRNWSYRYWINGKERWHGLGSLKDISLREARIKRDAARQQVRSGVDIVQAKRSAREEAKAVEATATEPTFKECAESYIDANQANWSKKHAAQWPSSLKQYAYPTIGHLRIREILPSHIFELLAPIWVEKQETSNRVRGRIETVIAKNVDIDDKDFRNPAELTKQLREKLPKRPKRKTRHHPALTASSAVAAPAPRSDRPSGVRARRDRASRRQLQGASAAFHKGAGGLRRVRIQEDAGISPIARSAVQKGPGAIRGLPFWRVYQHPRSAGALLRSKPNLWANLPSASACDLMAPWTLSRERPFTALRSVPRRNLRTKRVGRLTGSPA
jgi:hypothetical protein